MRYPINYRKEEEETNETFAKRVYETVKRISSCGDCNLNQTRIAINRISKYYQIEYNEVIDLIRSIEYNNPSKKYRIQYVQCLGKYYLTVEKR